MISYISIGRSLLFNGAAFLPLRVEEKEVMKNVFMFRTSEAYSTLSKRPKATRFAASCVRIATVTR